LKYIFTIIYNGDGSKRHPKNGFQFIGLQHQGPRIHLKEWKNTDCARCKFRNAVVEFIICAITSLPFPSIFERFLMLQNMNMDPMCYYKPQLTGEDSLILPKSIA
jgi:hypothetical protein